MQLLFLALLDDFKCSYFFWLYWAIFNAVTNFALLGDFKCSYSFWLYWAILNAVTHSGFTG